MNRSGWVLLILLELPLSGCVSDLGADTYSRAEARSPQWVQLGTVESLRPVNIEGTRTPIGSGAGAIAGGVAGSTVGHGPGRTVAAVAGALLGGVVGAAVEEGVTRSTGVEITVRQSDGSLRAYVQQLEPNQIFRVGQRVEIHTSQSGVSRVIPLQ